MAGKFRTEKDSMGSLQVPADALYGAQTQRAVENFRISGRTLPPRFLHALASIKAACAEANHSLGLLDRVRAKAIVLAARQVADAQHDEQFPLDVYQTGSGTSSNMNVNEVIAHLASAGNGKPVHPNDHVNLGQSSNDVVPSAIQVATVLAWREQLRPALRHLRSSIAKRSRAWSKTIKTGRTHLMDAMPLSFAQEFGAYVAQLDACIARLDEAERRQRELPLGGTAVGTGINADPRMARRACQALSRDSKVRFRPAKNAFAKMAAQDDALEFGGQLNVLAACLMKLSNDLRWMNSGPLAGLAEIELPALQPGSSIMPGKVNPVIPEAVAMVCARVAGNHQTLTIAGQSGNFQLNVMLPLIADVQLESIGLLANACTHLADKCILGLRLRPQRVAEALQRNPILVTALNPIIGYEKAAAIAKRAYAEQRPVFDVALEMSGLDAKTLKRLLDPGQLIQARKGQVGGAGG